jgi:hypothetical protein
MKKLFALLIAMLLPCIALADAFDRELSETIYNELADYYHLQTLPEPEPTDNGYVYRGEDFAIAVRLVGDELYSVLLLYNVPLSNDLSLKMRDMSSCVLGAFTNQDIDRFYDAFSTYILCGERFYSDHENNFAVQLQKADNGGQLFLYMSTEVKP